MDNNTSQQSQAVVTQQVTSQNNTSTQSTSSLTLQELIYYPSLLKSVMVLLGAMIFTVACVLFLLNHVTIAPSFTFYFIETIVIAAYLFRIGVNRTYKLLAVGIAVVMLLLYFIFGSNAINVVGILLFGVGGILYGWRSFIQKPFVLRLTKIGIETSAGLKGNISLNWDEVASLSVAVMPMPNLMINQDWHFLAIHLKDIAKTSERYPSLNNSLASLAQKMNGTPLAASLDGLSKKSSQVAEEIKNFVQPLGVVFQN